ncbi:type II toxin-antitoxin system RelE/ParE family toxin [Bacillus piscicola]|uniref:type II toxin-antitoxin system RelE/ParE family toxin n=1 Tax=Bacillus piscicola TaxID=1632684 RepID=UPI001F089DDA|nr:type II toxin-antitoxin system RelE/ParE family toxin [Bacillus piscicola]
MTYQLVFHENTLLENVKQEKRTKGRGPWIALAERYIIQKERIRLYPLPEDFNNRTPEEENPPIIKHLERNTELISLFRWGLPGQATGNHRLLYVFHNYYKVILLHHFDKQYNGAIKRQDIQPAEIRYFDYCIDDPSLYPITKGE